MKISKENMIVNRKCNLEKTNVSGNFSNNNRTAYVIDIIKDYNVLNEYHLTQIYKYKNRRRITSFY